MRGIPNPYKLQNFRASHEGTEHLSLPCYMFLEESLPFTGSQFPQLEKALRSVVGGAGVAKVEATSLFFFCLLICFSFFVILGFELRAFTLSHSTSPIFVKRFLRRGSLELFALGWLQTTILLISDS
jgi:hypothetical protein